MNMKQLFIQLITAMLLSLTACQSEVIPEESGDKIALSFNLYRAELTKAESGSTQLAEGTKIRAYAYTKGAVTTGSPVGTGDYVVNAAGTAVAADKIGLTLYRGEYDIYLVSYNDQNFYPTANGVKNLIEVSNGKDFMYSNLKGITVQPTSAGEDMMSVTLPEPFTRLCSNVIIKVQASGNQPVTVATLTVSSVSITKLSGNLSYQMGETVWNNGETVPQTGTAGLGEADFSIGDKDDAKVSRENITPLVILPLTGTDPLEFKLNLNIGYMKGGQLTHKIFTYIPKVYKSFLPGMTYEFEFTLTFFGDQEPTDLSLAILEYTTVKFSTDEVGK